MHPKSLLTLCALFVFSLAGTSGCATAETDIPPVETWPKIEAKGSRNTSKVVYPYFLTWHRDPRRSVYEGYESVVGYNKATKVMFLKAWNFKCASTKSCKYDGSSTRVALLLDNETWFVGDVGERMTFIFAAPVDESRRVVVKEIKFCFEEHSNICRTVKTP